MKRFLLPIFLVLSLLLITAFPVKAGTVTSYQTYVWYGSGSAYEEYATTNIKAGDYVKMRFDISSFTNVANPTVTDPVGNSIPVKNSTWTVSPYYLWFNTTIPGTYTVSITVDNVVQTYTIQVGSWAINSYNIYVKDVDGQQKAPAKMKSPSGDIYVAPAFFSPTNGSITVEVAGSLAQPFSVQVKYGSTLLGSSTTVYPHGQSAVSVTIPIIEASSTIISLGKVQYSITILPAVASSLSITTSPVYFVPADDFSVGTITYSATLPSSVTIGSSFTISSNSASVSTTKTVVGDGNLYAPLLLQVDSGYMVPVDSSGNYMIFPISGDITLSKFRGTLPSVGSRTMAVGPMPLSALLSGNYRFLMDSAGTILKKSGTVTVNPGGTFYVQINNPNLTVGQQANVLVKWDRKSVDSWLLSGDKIDLQVDVKVLIGSSVYNEAFAKISGLNGTLTNTTVAVAPVKYNHTALTGSATVQVLTMTGGLLASNSTSIPYYFSGYHIQLLLDGQPYTPPASGLPVEIYSGGSLLFTINMTSSEAYVYTLPSITVKADKTIGAVRVTGEATATSKPNAMQNVQLNLKMTTAAIGDTEYIPAGYTGDINVAIKATLDVGTYKLKNYLTAKTDPVATGSILISWDDSTKKTATISVQTPGTYVITYVANNGTNAYTASPLVEIYDSYMSKKIAGVKAVLVSSPGYSVKIDQINNTVKISISAAKGALPLADKIKVKVSPTSLRLVQYVKAERVSAWDDYTFLMDKDGYLIYEVPMPSAGVKQTVTINANATYPVDLSPAISQYSWSETYAATFEITGAAVAGVPAAGIPLDYLLLIVLALVLAVAVIFAFKR
jgi:hypothetical protein